MNVAQRIVSSLEQLGVKNVYGLIGVSVLDLLDSLKDSDIRYISTRHEQTAVSMADAEGRINGRAGVAVVHAGPGLLNSMISIANAYKDSSPLLVITGGVKRRMRGLDSWLEVDQIAMIKPITKFSSILKPHETSTLISQAYSMAQSPPFGPAVIEVPEDIWSLEAGDAGMNHQPRCPPPPPAESIAKVSELLQQSSRPLILAGGGVNWPDASSLLVQLVESLGIPVITTGNGRASYPEDRELSLGRVGFGGGTLPADFALENADFILALGAGFSDVSTYGYLLMPKGKKVVVDLDAAAERKPVALTMHIMADAFEFLKLFLSQPKSSKHEWRQWVDQLMLKKKEWHEMLAASSSRPGGSYVNPSKFFTYLNERMGEDVIVTAGQGVHILYAYDFLKLKKPRSFLAATNLGAMGFAFPAALGAKIASRSKRVMAILGDGEFMMTVHDLETMARERIGVKLIIVNDNTYRVLYMRQKLQKMGRLIGTQHTNPDIVRLADSFNIDAISINSDEQIDSAIDFLLKDDSPSILELVIDPDDMPPLNLELSSRF